MAPLVTSLPAVFVAGTYRLAPAARWPAQYEDVRDAIRYVHQHVGRVGGDPSRIVVGGHSAGGHLASAAVLKREIPAVRACFPVSSPFDLRYGDVSPDSEEGRVYKFLLAQRSQDADASPLAFVPGNEVPFHIVWGSHDFDRIVRSGNAMKDALEQVGSEVTHEVVADAGHFDTHLRLADLTNPWYSRLRQALYE